MKVSAQEYESAIPHMEWADDCVNLENVTILDERKGAYLIEWVEPDRLVSDTTHWVPKSKCLVCPSAKLANIPGWLYRSRVGADHFKSDRL